MDPCPNPDEATLERLRAFLAEEEMLEEGLTFITLPSAAEIAKALESTPPDKVAPRGSQGPS